MEIHDHLRNLLFIRQMNIVRNLLGHLSNNDISHIIVLELIIFVTGFALFTVPDAPIDNAVLVPLIIELQSLFAESFFTQNQTVLVTVGVEMYDTQPAVNLNNLTPVWSTTWFVKFYRFKLERETVLLYKFVTSCINYVWFLIFSNVYIYNSEFYLHNRNIWSLESLSSWNPRSRLLFPQVRLLIDKGRIYPHGLSCRRCFVLPLANP